MPTHVPQHESIELVLVGSFNPAIFHPQWFVRHELISEEDVSNAITGGKVTVVSTEVTDVTVAGLRVLCTTQRLTIATSNVAYFERVHDLVIGSLTLLSHVPIRAIGINPRQHYATEGMEHWHKIGHRLAPKDEVWNELYEQPGMLRLSIHARRTGEFPGDINVTVQPSDRSQPGLMIYVNNHFEVPERFQQTEAAEFAITCIRREWNDARAESARVANKIFEKILP